MIQSVLKCDGATTNSLILIFMLRLTRILSLSELPSLINNVYKKLCPYMCNVFSKQ